MSADTRGAQTAGPPPKETELTRKLRLASGEYRRSIAKDDAYHRRMLDEPTEKTLGFMEDRQRRLEKEAAEVAVKKRRQRRAKYATFAASFLLMWLSWASCSSSTDTIGQGYYEGE